MRNIDWFEILIGLVFLVMAIGVAAMGIIGTMYDGASNEEIKQLKQSVVEQKQEAESYRNRSLELENIIEESDLVVDNCECY